MRSSGITACNARSALVLGFLLLSAFVVLDSYTWRALSTWGSLPSRLAGSITNVDTAGPHARLVSPEEAAADIAQANREWKGAGSSDSQLPDETTSAAADFPSNASDALPPAQDDETSTAKTPDSSNKASDKSADGNGGTTESSSPQETSTAEPPETAGREPPPLQDAAELPKTSLQKLESGLLHARSAIRRALLSGTPDRADSVEFHPDVYLNATIFLQSYYEMEKRLKVFVYPEGEEPLVHNGPCKEIYAIEGRFIQELQGKNGYLTSDPEKAHVFFLPFSVAMMVMYLYTPGSGDMSSLGRFTEDYINVISHQYSFWNRSRGADHFMVSCHDWGPHVSRAHPDLRTKSIRVLCNANKSEGYVPNKDASLPEIHLVGGELPKDLGGPPAADRKYLAFFSGGDHGPVRPVLFKHWKENDDEVRVFQTLPSRETYQDYMRHSKYCLCPGGYEVNSPRIVEAINNDCVPVIIADDFVLPFSDVLAWDKFSVKLLEADIPKLKEKLQAIPTDKYLEMQARIRWVRRHFQFNQPPQRYDVFNMILHSVWLRRLNMVIRE